MCEQRRKEGSVVGVNKGECGAYKQENKGRCGPYKRQEESGATNEETAQGESYPSDLLSSLPASLLTLHLGSYQERSQMVIM